MTYSPPPPVEQALSLPHRSWPFSREEWLLAGVSGATLLLALFQIVVRGSLFEELKSNHNLRLLNSTLAWLDHGFLQLGGSLLFQETYDHRLPTVLYQSHAPWYVLPHYWAISAMGEEGFWLVTGSLPILVAILMATAIAAIAYRAIDDAAVNFTWARHPNARFVAAATAFSICVAAEPIWSLAWNSYDGSYGIVWLTISIALAAWAGKGNPFIGHMALLTMWMAALFCARLGLALALVLVLVRHFGLGHGQRRSLERGLVLFSWPAIVGVMAAALSHFLRIALAERLLGLHFQGSALLGRMGFSDRWQGAGQGRLDYKTPIDAFTFLWRQSEIVIGKLPLWISLHHLLIWSLALAGFIALVGSRRRFPSRPLLEVLLLVPLLMTVGLNQSSAEHPDLVAMLWLPAYVLGMSFLMTGVFMVWRKRLRKDHAYYYLIAMLFLFFLWQIQYLVRAYPQLN